MTHKYSDPINDAFQLRSFLDADWHRLHEFGGQIAPKRRFSSNFSPRFAPIMLIRLAHWCFIKGFRRIAKLISLCNYVIFGLEVPARLNIGPGLVIPHTIGTIIGAGYVGKNATIYQQVTLGAKLVDFAYDPLLRPHIGNNVTITAGAKVLGSVHLGDGCTVGANAVVIFDIPPNALAVGVPAKIIFR